LLAGAALPQPIRTHALGIYDLLARAEAAVHGVALAETHFHELGDWDSVADVLCAATIINALPAVRWHYEPLPLGHGIIATAHGRLPVPAPATAWLLREFRCHDDGIPGERVTPTGAAILRYLNAASDRPSGSFEFLGTGCGAGSIELPGIPNVLRLLFLARSTAREQEAGSVVVVRFEVDDQTPEDLAIGLDRVRAIPGVLDVVMWSACGKKGRMISAIQVIAQNERHAEAIQACLAETATIGVRWQQASRSVLARTESMSVDTEGGVRVKRVLRPGGTETRKAEADDIGQLDGDFAARSMARRRAEGETDESA
jgi:hypothetical protein